LKIITSKKFAKKLNNIIDKSTKNKISGELKAAGLDGNGRFPEADSGIRVIWDILEKYGLSLDMASKDLFIGPNGTRRFSLQRKNVAGGSFDPGQEIKNSMIVYSWAEMGTGKYEIVVYLS